MQNMMESGILPWVLMAGVVYFFMIRPKQKEAKQREAMLAELKVGDKVSTYAGIIGVITQIDNQNFTMKTGDSKIEFSRTAIQQKVTQEA